MTDEYEVWWDGSKKRRRGYLCVPPYETRPAPTSRANVMEDWSAKPPIKMTLLDRVAYALTERPCTSRELQLAMGVPQSSICIALTALRQTGKLREQSLTSTHPRARGKQYWIVP